MSTATPPPRAMSTAPRFKVENGVPMPEPRKKDPGYPFLDMMPSQSFFIAEKDPKVAARCWRWQ